MATGRDEDKLIAPIAAEYVLPSHDCENPSSEFDQSPVTLKVSPYVITFLKPIQINHQEP